MLPSRGELEVEDLLKVVLVLVIVWILVEIVLGVLEFAFSGLGSLFGVVIVILIVAYLLDYV